MQEYTTYTATEGERLDVIYFKAYGINAFNQRDYDNFLLANAKLLKKDFLDGGDGVQIPTITQEPSQNDQSEGLYAISL
ncbi:hypothetical protein BKH46_08845 [Helicobacter sp. 12S02634-8]|uniref:hypothetical protein n=1 Tax=Helicobacter sp. 12S02634-8 TaxID=1476199 RepID=UPI000BA784B6|nr:hypothetical protein [Helicobacter sp. 12S02634-8]PAF46144.1 hypothetical protein BKH46_08845 [Helicobacter sp. 12S02634-8]